MSTNGARLDSVSNSVISNDVIRFPQHCPDRSISKVWEAPVLYLNLSFIQLEERMCNWAKKNEAIRSDGAFKQRSSSSSVYWKNGGCLRFSVSIYTSPEERCLAHICGTSITFLSSIFDPFNNNLFSKPFKVPKFFFFSQQLGLSIYEKDNCLQLRT